jgi:hypothetical protein
MPAPVGSGGLGPVRSGGLGGFGWVRVGWDAVKIESIHTKLKKLYCLLVLVSHTKVLP